jgi:hypothetical protein
MRPLVTECDFGWTQRSYQGSATVSCLMAWRVRKTMVEEKDCPRVKTMPWLDWPPPSNTLAGRVVEGDRLPPDNHEPSSGYR